MADFSTRLIDMFNNTGTNARVAITVGMKRLSPWNEIFAMR